MIAFQFGHAMLKLVIVGRASMPLMQEAPSLAAGSPVLIQYNDPEYSGPRAGPEAAGCEVFPDPRQSGVRKAMPGDERDAISISCTSGTTGGTKA